MEEAKKPAFAYLKGVVTISASRYIEGDVTLWVEYEAHGADTDEPASADDINVVSVRPADGGQDIALMLSTGCLMDIEQALVPIENDRRSTRAGCDVERPETAEPPEQIDAGDPDDRIAIAASAARGY